MEEKTPKFINFKPTGDSAIVVVDIFLGKHMELMGYISVCSVPENDLCDVPVNLSWVGRDFTQR